MSKKTRKLNIKNLIIGAGSIMEIAPPKRTPYVLKRIYYNPAPTSQDALKTDWEKVGNTFGTAINRYKT